MSKYNVAVLMSTYNGEKYIQQQIESLLMQQDIALQIYIRDDGSTDSTKSILQQYAKKENIRVFYGENLGPTKSFWELITNNSIQADFYALADQDDYWFPEKLKVACEKLEMADGEKGLYFSNMILTDGELKEIGFKDMTPRLNVAAALVTNRAYGCTIVINNLLREYIMGLDITYVPEHDTKIYQIAVAVKANIVFDKESYIYYRQHEYNVVGARESFVKRNKKRIVNTLIKRKHIRRSAARALLSECYDCISAEDREKIRKLAEPGNMIQRIKLVLDKEYESGDSNIDRNFKISVLFNLV